VVRVRHLRKAFDVEQEADGRVAVDDVSFDNPAGRFLTLLGPSGCGKTTTLRCIAGLEIPDDGDIEIGDRTVYSSSGRVNVAPGKREVGMVFQSYAIWPHMTVAQNVEYPLKRRKVRGPDRKKRVHDLLEMMGLEGLAGRPAPALSGGQQQRVALARAIVAEPRVLLLDEPLSNLDARLRRELGGYLRELQQTLGLTVVYVTHDQDEAMAMSDVVALMEHGKMVEWGTPEEVYRRPRTEFGARFVGDANFANGEITEVRDGVCRVNSNYGPLKFVDGDRRHRAGQEVLLMLRPEHGALESRPAGVDATGPNTLVGTLKKATFRGAYWECHLDMGEEPPIEVRVAEAGSWRLGATAAAHFPPEACIPVARTTTHIEDASGAMKALHEHPQSGHRAGREMEITT
jgi:iron(III) transport system ATP-binding protein